MIIPVALRPHTPLLLYTLFILAILPLDVLRKEKIKGPYELRCWGKLSVSSHQAKSVHLQQERERNWHSRTAALVPHIPRQWEKEGNEGGPSSHSACSDPWNSRQIFA